MATLWTLLLLLHLFGLALGVGAATVKLSLLLKANKSNELLPVYIKVIKPITNIIIMGMVILTLTGIGWIIMGTVFTTLFIVKLILVAAVWILGPIIDNVVGPKFEKLAPVSGDKASPEFLSIKKQLLMLEVTATLLFYIITVMGLLIHI